MARPKRKRLIDKAEDIAHDIADNYKKMALDDYSKTQTTLDTLTKFLTLKAKLDEGEEAGSMFNEGEQ